MIDTKTSMFDPAAVRSYRDSDLAEVLTFVGQCAADPRYGGEHPGDILHTMSNSLRGRFIDPATCFYVYWPNDHPEAVIRFERPGNSTFGVIMHPDDAQADPELEAALTDWASRYAISREPEPLKPDDKIMASANTFDSAHRERLERSGWVADAPYLLCSQRDLFGELPDFPLPERFVMRGTDESDVEQLCAVHNSAFRKAWTAERYLNVMRTPGFDPARELVAVAPDGQFTAFVVIWFEPISKIGLFEPVGTHESFQRRGLGKALMSEGLRRMRAAGMTQARVNHQFAADNPASAALYASMGFIDRYEYFDMVKTVAEVLN